MPSSKKQSIESRIRSSAVTFSKTRNGHMLLRSCGIGTIAIGAFLSLLSFFGSFVMGFEGSIFGGLLLFVLSIAFLILSIAGCVVAIAHHAALRKARGRYQSRTVTPRWFSVMCGLIAALPVFGVVSVILWYLIKMCLEIFS